MSLFKVTITTNTNNSANYVTDLSGNYGVFQVTSSIASFTNSARVYADGGYSTTITPNGTNGANAIQINSGITVTKLTNTGLFNGGGGSGANSANSLVRGGKGGSGGGGGAGSVNATTGTGGISGDLGGAGGSCSNTNCGGGGGFGGAGVATGAAGGGGPGIGGYSGGVGSNSGGGGSSGGGIGSGTVGNRFGGTGGYGIRNLGTITTLANLQGFSSAQISVNGTSVYTIPLYITGKVPTNYNIIINDTNSIYGQLYGKSVTGTISSFDIDVSSNIILSTGNSKTYNNIFNGITISTTSGISLVNGINYSWNISSNNLTITNNGIACYNKNSLILSLYNNIEQYIPIQNLIPGDIVKTYLHGYKKIELIGKQNILNYPNNELKSMYKIVKHKDMTDDLIVTGGHYILVDKINNNRNFYNRKLMIDDKYVLLTCDYEFSEKICNNDLYTIYMLVLEGEQERYGIYVNGGLLSESTSKNNFIKHNYLQLK